MTEAELQQLLTDAAHMHGWLVFHDHDSRRNARGFPDLVMVHGQRRRVLFLELKSDTGRLRPEQREWMAALDQCDTIGSAVVRPGDADQIIAYLAKPNEKATK